MTRYARQAAPAEPRATGHANNLGRRTQKVTPVESSEHRVTLSPRSAARRHERRGNRDRAALRERSNPRL